jgi:hypothetical protein
MNDDDAGGRLPMPPNRRFWFFNGRRYVAVRGAFRRTRAWRV